MLIMDAIIGRYRVRMEENGLTLKHAAGINFDLTVEETLGLFDFINVYRETLLTLRQADPETDPRLERVVIHDEDNQ
jgi:hypothetical protein